MAHTHVFAPGTPAEECHSHNDWRGAWHREVCWLAAAILTVGTAFGVVRFVGGDRRATGSGDRPALVVRPLELDFGALTSSAIITRSIRLENGGDRPVSVTGIVQWCNCLQPRVRFPLVVPPMAKAEIPLSMHAMVDGGAVGEVRKRVTLKTDDPQHPSYEFEVVLRYAVEAKPRLVPDTVDFGTIGGWEVGRRKLQLEFHGEKPLGAQRTSVSLAGAQLLSQSGSDGAVRQFELVIPRELSKGGFAGTCRVITSAGDAVMEFRGKKAGPVVCSTSTLVFRPGGSVSPVAKTVALRHSPDATLRIMDVKSDLGTVTASTTSISPPGTTNVDVRFATMSAKPPARGTLEIHTNLDLEPVRFNCFILQ